ncbi:hypothetical protein [Dasania marina]|uniref:hypothetical protein n=1 Tax=Dasania marina TaxID=471499 RepID=UPI000367C0AA|nr:hypothetical protein [Dasania marina]
MTRVLFYSALLLGGLAIVWMGASFIGTNSLALIVTLLIGLAYLIGAFELFHYRKQTASLSHALKQINGAVDNLDLWLSQLHPALKNAVRARISGESVGLPAPVVSPYLIGLLVMLGLLGTFLGMVATLQGAVSALEGTSELQAIRAGLAAPIQGLGLAFGTSVAGVAASAMLGLMSTLSRSERIQATETLDSNIHNELREFSLNHSKQQTYSALQQQAAALPDVADKLNTLADKLITMSEKIEQSLTAQQQAFHSSVAANYSELALSIDKSLQQTLADSGKLAGENIKPIIETMMAEISSNTSNTHKTLTDTVQEQLSTLRSDWQQQQLAHDEAKLAQWAQTFEQLNQKTHQQFDNAGQQLVAQLQQASDAQQTSVQTIVSEFSQATAGLNEQWQQANQQSREQQQAISASLSSSSESLTTQLSASTEKSLSAISKLIASSEELVKTRAEAEQHWLNHYEQRATQLNEKLAEQLGSNTQQNITEISKLLTSTEELVKTRTDAEQHWLQHYEQRATQLNEKLAEQLGSNTEKNIAEISKLLASADQLIQSRTESEQAWLNQNEQRATQFNETLQSTLNQLRDDEQQRGLAALERLGQLEGKLSEHLCALGQGLEAPMARLIETASETPKAAAQVIEQLRNEISKNLVKDNALLEERSGIMTELDKLSASLAQTATDQRQSIETLITASEQMLSKASEQFGVEVEQQVAQLAEVNTEFSGNSIEMASLGEAFTLAVQHFDESNNNLIASLSRIETSLQQSGARSDEQLGYYVAQARDLIDHSIVSQKAMFDELREIKTQQISLALEDT